MENWIMNNKQKKCLWIGIALIVVMGLFPPWVLESEKKTKNYLGEGYTEPPQSTGNKGLKTTAGQPDFGKRMDGTPEGTGWLGVKPITYPDGTTGETSEYSIRVMFDNGKKVEIPSLVPGLSKEQENLMLTDIIPNHKRVPPDILRIAVDHAKKRIAEGISPFAANYESPQAKTGQPAAATIDTMPPEEQQPNEYTLIKDTNPNVNQYVIRNTNPVKAREEETERQQATDDFRQRIAAKRQEEIRQGWVWQYTPEQQKRLKALDNNLDNLPEAQILRAKSYILPHKGPRPPTPQEELKQKLTSDGRGGQWIKNEKTGDWKPVVAKAHEYRYTTEPGPYSWIGDPPARAKFVDLYRLGIQYFVVAVVTAGLIITLRDKKDPKQ